MTSQLPNILLIQADQLRPQSLPVYGHPVVKTPHLDSIAEDGVVFENAYCNNPICASSRFSMLCGQYSSRIGAYDNGAEFSSDIPTIAHYLRANGYQTCLSGKMHFVGAVIEEQVRNARRAYYGQISYIDDKTGEITHALHQAGLDQNTVIFFVADHGDMLGEKGLWYKMSFFEESVRVPFIIKVPGITHPGRVTAPVSLVDLMPTVLELTANPGLESPAAKMDGHSLCPFWKSDTDPPDYPVISEFFAEGSIAPCFMVRLGEYKYIYSQPDPPQLYHPASDPAELVNLAGDPKYSEIEQDLRNQVLAHQDPDKIYQAVLDSQKRRNLVFQANMTGKRTSWDFSPKQDASSQYMRNHLDLNEVERLARIKSRD